MLAASLIYKNKLNAYSGLPHIDETALATVTDKLFGTDNLGNLGDYELNSATYDIDTWGYDASDGNIIIHANDGTHVAARALRD